MGALSSAVTKLDRNDMRQSTGISRMRRLRPNMSTHPEYCVGYVGTRRPEQYTAVKWQCFHITCSSLHTSRAKHLGI